MGYNCEYKKQFTNFCLNIPLVKSAIVHSILLVLILLSFRVFHALI